ncbi:uncharacterized protein LOC135502022 [Lineus longissimus]|uniref:uncharacterized protein LOC135502022 n=1 Tax=Lineus longissimus TaxID=88925 RepID=UPI002B4F7068
MWFKNNGETLKRINDDFKHEVNKIAVYPGHNRKEGDLWMTLRIMQLQQDDYGNYTCAGENIYGRGSDIVTLFHTPTCQGPACGFETSDRNSAGSVVATKLYAITMATLVTIWRIF